MKKSLIFLFALLFMGSIAAQAQLKWGVKAGLNLSEVSFNKEVINSIVDNYTGFQVGPMVEFTVPIIGIGMDAAILYSHEGFKLGRLDDLGNLGEILNIETQTFRTNNLIVPVNLKYKLTFMGVAGAYATAGPYAKFRLSDLGDQWKDKSFGAGLNFGIGVELLSMLQIGVNYQLGLTNDFSTIGVSDILKAKDRMWTVSAAYLF
jgi:hypothetical protein